MSEITTFYEAINPDTHKTRKYKIIQSDSGRYFKVSKHTGGIFPYSTLKEFLQSEQSALQVLRADATRELGNAIFINKIN